jgi:hypothetical protein
MEHVMPESDGLRLGRAAISHIFLDAAKLTEFLRRAAEFRINVQTCDWKQIESVIREVSPPAGAIAARGGRAVVSYQGLPDNEDEVLQEFFRQKVEEAKTKHPDLIK